MTSHILCHEAWNVFVTTRWQSRISTHQARGPDVMDAGEAEGSVARCQDGGPRKQVLAQEGGSREKPPGYSVPSSGRTSRSFIPNSPIHPGRTGPEA